MNDYLHGAVGHFERQTYGQEFMLDALEALKAYVFGVGPRPALRFDSPVNMPVDQQDLPTEMPRVLRQQPAEPVENWPNEGEAQAIAEPLPYPYGDTPYPTSNPSQGEQVREIASMLQRRRG